MFLTPCKSTVNTYDTGIIPEAKMERQETHQNQTEDIFMPDIKGTQKANKQLGKCTILPFIGERE